MHPLVNAWTDFLTTAACLLIIGACGVLTWLMNKAPAGPRAWAGMAFFALIVAQALDYMLSFLNIDHHDIGETWHMITLRLIFAIAAATFAAILYRDLGGTKRHG